MGGLISSVPLQAQAAQRGAQTCKHLRKLTIVSALLPSPPITLSRALRLHPNKTAAFRARRAVTMAVRAELLIISPLLKLVQTVLRMRGECWNLFAKCEPHRS